MKKVLMAVDEAAGSLSALSVYKTLVRQPECVVLVHAYENDPGMNSAKILDTVRKELEAVRPVTIRILAREGIPSEEILKAARDESVDLIIMGRSGRNGLRGLFARSTVREVERAAPVPVLVAKTAGDEKSITDSWRGAYAA